MIPAVDVLEGKVVRLLRGDYTRVTEYGSDPVATARRWMDEGARRVHVVDLDGARTGEVDLLLWKRLAGPGVTFQAGGGIRRSADARRVLEAGAERVVMGTAAVWDPLSLDGLGDQVVAAVDVKGGKATGEGWQDSGRDLDAVLEGLAEARVGRVLVTGIGRDGTLGGADVELTRQVVEDNRFAVIASGGVGTLGDLESLAALGCEAVVVGKALYERRFTLADVIARFGRP